MPTVGSIHMARIYEPIAENSLISQEGDNFTVPEDFSADSSTYIRALRLERGPGTKGERERPSDMFLTGGNIVCFSHVLLMAGYSYFKWKK